MNDRHILQKEKFVNYWDVLVYLLGICSVFFHIAVFEGYSEILTFGLLLALGLFIFRGENQRYFLIAFSLNVFAAVLQGTIFFHVNGEPFAGGGDDRYFYDQAIKMIDGRKVKLGNYWVYLYINYGIYSIGEFLGFTDFSYLNIGYSNAFVGATIAPCMNNIVRKYFNEYYAKKTVYFVLFFPILISYSGLLLRDIWVAAIFVWIMHIVLSDTSVAVKIILCLFCFYLSFGFRVATAVVSALFFLSYAFYGLKSWWLKFSIGAVLVFLFFAFFYQNIVAVQDVMADKYQGLAQAVASDNSLGAKFVHSNNPVVKGIYFIILLYNPVPPYRSFVADDLFVAVGATIWYFVLPGFVLGIFKAMKDAKMKRFAFAFATSVVVLLIALFTIAADERHKLLMYAPAIFFYVYYLQQYTARFRARLLFIYCCVVALLVLVYLVMKFQLI